MMKSRSSRVISEQAAMTMRSSKVDSTNSAQLNAAQTSAQAIRKRRSSINVYDQPSSLNSRLRQLETDMLRLDEDRTKLYDETHSALAQYELKLGEIHAILKSRKDNVEKYVEDMKSLLIAKEEFEKQAKMLHEKHDRVHEKFMHRETTISREIKLLKNKFELLEKSRQFKSVLQQKSSSGNLTNTSDNNDDSGSGSESVMNAQRTKSETASETNSMHLERNKNRSSLRRQSKAAKSVRMKLAKLNVFARFFSPLMRRIRGKNKGEKKRTLRGKGNRVASVFSPSNIAKGLDSSSSVKGDTQTSAAIDSDQVATPTTAKIQEAIKDRSIKAAASKASRLGVFIRLFKKNK